MDQTLNVDFEIFDTHSLDKVTFDWYPQRINKRLILYFFLKMFFIKIFSSSCLHFFEWVSMFWLINILSQFFLNIQLLCRCLFLNFYLFNLRTDIMYLYVGEKLIDVLCLQKIYVISLSVTLNMKKLSWRKVFNKCFYSRWNTYLLWKKNDLLLLALKFPCQFPCLRNYHCELWYFLP